MDRNIAYRSLELGHNGVGLPVMGELERKRLSDVVTQAQRAGIKGSIAETLGDERLVDIVAHRFHVPIPSQGECRRYYLLHPEEFRAPDQFEGRHIVLPCDPADRANWGETRARAERLIAILQFAPGMFADLLASYGGNGASGTIGPEALAILPPALRAAFSAARPGQVCPTPVETDMGIHVVILDTILSGEMRAFKDASSDIARLLHDRMRSDAARRHLKRLARRHAVMELGHVA